MKYMRIGPAIKPSSFPPLMTTLTASDYGLVVGSTVRECKLIRSSPLARLSTLKSGQLNFSENVAKEFNLQQQRQKAIFVGNAGSEFSAQDSEVDPQIAAGNSLTTTFDIFCRFTRFYALRGAVLVVISTCMLAVQSLSDFTPSFFLGLLQAIIGGCLANSFVVSINQITDLEIDKVNKPYLPLTSGELSPQTGILLTAFYAISGLCLTLYVRSWPLKFGLFTWYAYGVGYSIDLPLLRWKANRILALTSIWLFHGVLIPIFFHLHAQVYIFERPLLLSKHAIFSVGLLSIFAIVIALFKDLSDVEGDVKNGIKTFASQLGQTRIFWTCIWLLEMAFCTTILVGLLSTHSWIRLIMVVSHIVLAFILWKYANMADLNSKKDLQSFYMLIWKLLYVEYFLLPISRF